VLGPLEVRSGGTELKIGPLKQRIALAILLCHANRVVPVTDLSEAIWGSDTPRTAHKNLQVYISLLRSILFPGDGAARLSYRFPGYRIEIAPAELDLLTFEGLVRGGRAAIQRGDAAAGTRLLHAALKTWRGTALTDLASLPVLDAEANRLNSLRASVVEDWAEAELALGNHAGALDEIQEQVSRHPLRERLRRVQLLALSRSGRHTEALAEYDELRVCLSREFGLEPSLALRQVYRAILAGDPGVRPPVTAVKAQAASREVLAHTALLPPAASKFVGREAELATLAAAMRGGPGGVVRACVLAGPPGAGKTTLAVRACHQLRDVFRDGQLLLPMRTPGGKSRTALDLLGQFLRMTGLDGAMPRRLEERAALYRAFMASRTMLLVLDDTADASVVPWLLPGATGNGVLVTSRRRLVTFDASCHLDVGSFTAAEAMSFLAEMIGTRRVEAEPEAALAIVESCGRLPLAVRTAGSKLLLQPYLPLAALAQRLSDDAELFDVLEIGALSLRACMADLVRELGPGQLQALRTMAALPAADWELDAVASAFGRSRQRAEHLIEELLEVNALEAARDGQFTLPRLLRVYLNAYRP
jgi:DNA-binding SARP family transcriptional activator